MGGDHIQEEIDNPATLPPMRLSFMSETVIEIITTKLKLKEETI